jgi:hypothetical protein
VMGKGGGTRHAKNQCTQAHYSQAERKADGYGSQKQRLGGESLLPFGTCCISLKPVVNPLVSKKGDLFSRDAIVEYLAYQKVQQRKEKALYEADQARIRREAEEEEATEKAAALDAFARQESGLAAGGRGVFQGKVESYSSSDVGNRGEVSAVSADGESIFVPEGEKDVSLKRPNPWAHEAAKRGSASSASSYREGATAKLRKMTGMDTDAARAKKLEVYENERAQVKAFWIPAHTPGADAVVAKPSTKGQVHPWGSYPLKFKNLIPVTFTPVDASKGDQTVAHHEFENRFMCPVTFKTFGRATKACVLKPSGHVVHASVVEDYIKKFGTCPITSKPCRVKDCLMLKEGGTGFAAHGSENVEATKFANAGHYG